MTKRATAYLYNNDFFSLDDLIVIGATKTKATFSNNDGTMIVFEGKNLKYESGMISQGTIQSFTAFNEDGDKVQKGFDFSVNAGSIDAETPKDFFNMVAGRVIFGGVILHGSKTEGTNLFTSLASDILIGGKGDDTLSAGAGNDVMTGGSGSDVFQFGSGFDRDKITDFDADGGEGKQDFINADFGDVLGIHKSGKHDTVIDFGNGDTLTLLDVKSGHIDATDFFMLP